MNLEELAAELISFMQDAYPGVLAEKYTINEKQNSYSVLEAIAESRHCLVRGNELDTAKVAGMAPPCWMISETEDSEGSHLNL